MASTYVIKLSGLNIASDVHIPNLVEEVRDRRYDLGMSSVYTHGAFDNDPFDIAKAQFRAAIEDLQDLQDKTIRRLDMGADGLRKIVEHHEENESWITDELTEYENELSDDVTDY